MDRSFHEKHPGNYSITSFLPGLFAVLLACLALPLSGQTPASASLSLQQEEPAPRNRLHIGILYPLSTNGRDAAEYGNDFSFHLLMGLSREERKFTLSGISTVVRGNAFGVQLAGISNHTGGASRGFQLAGIYNHVGDTARGAGLAGVMNYTGNVRGFQVAGVMNHTGNAEGLQLAGVVNKAGSVRGFQAAGVVNIAKQVRGLQLAGLINIADSSDYPVALLNFIRKGEKSIGLSTDETANLLASFRSGGRVLYGILEAGYNLKSGEPLYALGGGLGAHIACSERFRVNAEISTLVLDDFHRGEYSKHSLRILPAYKLSDRLEVFAGPTVGSVYTDMPEGKKLLEHAFWEKTYGGGALHQWYAGFAAGVHFIL